MSFSSHKERQYINEQKTGTLTNLRAIARNRAKQWALSWWRAVYVDSSVFFVSVKTKVGWQLNVWHTRAHRMLLLTPTEWWASHGHPRLASAMSCRFYLNGLSLLHGVVIVPLDTRGRSTGNPEMPRLGQSRCLLGKPLLFNNVHYIILLADFAAWHLYAGWAWNAFGDSAEDCELDWACAEPLSCRHCNLYCQPPAVCRSLSADLRLRRRLRCWLSSFVTWFLLVFSV